MDNETGQEEHIGIDKDECNKLNYDQISEILIEKKFDPCDLNYNKRPNIYLRGKYRINKDGTKTLIKDRFIMFVTKKWRHKRVRTAYKILDQKNV